MRLLAVISSSFGEAELLAAHDPRSGLRSQGHGPANDPGFLRPLVRIDQTGHNDMHNQHFGIHERLAATLKGPIHPLNKGETGALPAHGGCRLQRSARTGPAR